MLSSTARRRNARRCERRRWCFTKPATSQPPQLDNGTLDWVEGVEGRRVAYSLGGAGLYGNSNAIVADVVVNNAG